jgi:hypothetical protein
VSATVTMQLILSREQVERRRAKKQVLAFYKPDPS